MDILLPLAMGSTFWVAVWTVLGMVGLFIILFLSERKK
ncbi:MAG: hypothetical protein RIS20_1042 [Bacteroidota bacterium]|jgi:hypothetical protein